MMAATKKVTLDNNGLATSSGEMTVYNYDPESGLFMGATVEHLTEGVGIPAHSTSVAPSAVKSGKVRVYSEGSWQQVEDHRGELVYNIENGEPVEVRLPGDYPDGTTPLKPATPFDFWNGEAWQTDKLAQQVAAVSDAKMEQASLINEANSLTQAWQTQLLLGIINDDDRLTLTVWMKYIQTVQNLEIAANGEVVWPEKPY